MPYTPSTYSGDPTTTLLDEVRFLVQDVGEGGLWLLTDLEYQYLMDTWLPRYDAITYVAAMAAETIAGRFAGAVSISADGVSVNVADLSDRYRALAAQLRMQYDAGQMGAADIASILVDYEPDASIAPLDFGVGMHDNPSAGRQAYGTRGPRWEDGRVVGG